MMNSMVNSVILGGNIALQKSIIVAKKIIPSKTYKEKFSFEQRSLESSRIMRKYPDRLPIIVARAKTCHDVPMINKKKYLVPNCLTVGQFLYVIRRKIILPSEKALFLFINGVLPPTAKSLGEIYDEYKDSDGFLYVTYDGENTFG
jgi:GABA(A) receptor-associated protein